MLYQSASPILRYIRLLGENIADEGYWVSHNASCWPITWKMSRTLDLMYMYIGEMITDPLEETTFLILRWGLNVGTMCQVCSFNIRPTTSTRRSTIIGSTPANRKHLCNIYTMSDQRQRRCADVVKMLYKWDVLCFLAKEMTALSTVIIFLPEKPQNSTHQWRHQS